MMRKALFPTTLAVVVLVAGVTAQPALARSVYVFQAVMTGADEVPGPGDSNAIGHVVIMTEPANDRLCWIVSWNRVDGTVFASHIHGPATTSQAAGVVLPLFVGQAYGSTGINQGCVESADIGPLIDAIVANPALYYVNVHSVPLFPAGAIRGQLG